MLILTACELRRWYKLFFGAETGATWAFSLKARMSSTPLLLAASISMMSKFEASSSYGKWLISCARIRATRCFSYATRSSQQVRMSNFFPDLTLDRKILVTWSWPKTSSKLRLRYLRYSAWLIPSCSSWDNYSKLYLETEVNKCDFRVFEIV